MFFNSSHYKDLINSAQFLLEVAVHLHQAARLEVQVEEGAVAPVVAEEVLAYVSEQAQVAEQGQVSEQTLFSERDQVSERGQLSERVQVSERSHNI